MIINATSHAMKNIWKFFLVIFLFITLLFVVLKNGIRIDSLELPKIKISQLYIKLDKKLIVYAHTLNIEKESKKTTSLAEVQDIFNKLPFFYAFFDTISIQNLILDNKTIHFLFKNEIFYIDSDFLTLDTKIRTWGESIEFQINQMELKDYKIKLKGNLQANLGKNLFNFRGTFHTFNINGGAEFKVEKNKLYYRLNTKKLNSLKPFMDFFSAKIDLDPIISGWIYKRIVANEYQIHTLEGLFDLKTYEFYPKLMKGSASAKNVTVKFHKNAPQVLVKDLDVILKDNKLIFNIKQANYEGKDVSDSEVYIYNLMTKGPGIILDIKTHALLDESIHKTLKVFHIHVPIVQTSGKTKANVLLDIEFDPLDVASYTGLFEVEDANLSVSGLPMFSKKATVKLDNDIVHIYNSNLQYKKIFDINTSGTFDIKKGIYESTNILESVHVTFGNADLLHVKDINSSATLNINDNNTTININKLNAILTFTEKNNIIEIKKLSNIYDDSKLMQQLKLKDGQIKINTENFKQYSVNAAIKDIDLPLRKNNQPIKSLNVNVMVDDNAFEVVSVDNNIKAHYKNGLDIKINNIDIEFDSSKLDEKIAIEDIKVEGIHSNLIDKNSTLKIPSDYFSYELHGNNMLMHTNLDTQHIYIKQTKKTFQLLTQNLQNTYINNIIGKELFKNGSFIVYLDGHDSKNYKGYFSAEKTTLKGMAFYNNLMAFINTIPSLMTLKNPGFNDDGYEINQAYIDFSRNGNILKIEKLTIDGKSADIIGQGSINLETKKIDMTLQIAMLKSLSNAVNQIPLVNFIFLGKDGKIYTKVKVEGTLDKPDISTQVITDTVLSPINIIKRTIQAPFKLFE